MIFIIDQDGLRADEGNVKKSNPNSNQSIISQYLYDDRDFNSLAVYVSTNRLPHDLSIWGFTEINGMQGRAEKRYDLTRSLSEYRFSWGGLGKALSLPGFVAQIEYNDITPGPVNLLRFGIAYKHKLQIPKIGGLGGATGWLQWRTHPYETDNDGGQASLIYFLPLHKNAIITGWVDLNYSENSRRKWVIGPFLNMKMSQHFWIVLRYRHNGIEEAMPSLDGTGWALGGRIDF